MQSIVDGGDYYFTENEDGDLVPTNSKTYQISNGGTVGIGDTVAFQITGAVPPGATVTRFPDALRYSPVSLFWIVNARLFDVRSASVIPPPIVFVNVRLPVSYVKLFVI